VRQHQFVQIAGPLGPFVDGYRSHLAAAGLSPGSVQHRVSQFSQISRWLASQGLAAGEFDEVAAGRYVAARANRGRVSWVSPLTARVPLEFLRGIAVVPARTCGHGPLEELLESYRRYLSAERGLADKTITEQLKVAERFCVAMGGSSSGLADLTASAVTSYLVTICSTQSRDGPVKFSVCEGAWWVGLNSSSTSTGSSQLGQFPPVPSRRLNRLQSWQRRSVDRSPQSAHS
jgi:integrase/recombinase XerD